MCNNHKKYSYLTEDRNYTIFVYFIFIVIMCCLSLTNSTITSIHQNFAFTYRILLFLEVISLITCVTFLIKKNITNEGLVLNFSVSMMIILFIEKTIVFILHASNKSFGYYIDYISLTVLALIFLAHRLTKIKVLLKSNDEIQQVKDDNKLYALKTNEVP